MPYPVTVPGFEGRSLEVDAPLLRAPRLLIDGEPVASTRGVMTLKRKDGRTVQASFKPRAAGMDVPVLIVGDQEYPPTKAEPWSVWLLCAWPIGVVIYGSFVAAVVGAIAVVANLAVWRSKARVGVRAALLVVIGAAVWATFVYTGGMQGFMGLKR